MRRVIVELDKFHCYLYIPYQSLQVLGYWLVGKRCDYQWGKSVVKPLGAITRRQQLVGLLFPVAVFYLILAVELVIATYILLRYYLLMPWLIIPLAVLAALPLSPYFYQVLFDTWRVYRLLKNQARASLPDSELRAK